MKTLGLIGGVGPESTVDYYRQLVSGFREGAGGSYPPVIINSVDLKRLLDWMAENRLQPGGRLPGREIRKLVTCWRPISRRWRPIHLTSVFDELQALRTKLPLLSIVEATARELSNWA